MYVLINIEGMARRKGGRGDIYPAYVLGHIQRIPTVTLFDK
jgi:hypothetical protein